MPPVNYLEGGTDGLMQKRGLGTGIQKFDRNIAKLDKCIIHGDMLRNRPTFTLAMFMILPQSSMYCLRSFSCKSKIKLNVIIA